MGRTTEMQSLADRRAERHARAFVAEQRPSRDAQVERLMAEGYLARQIASILNRPVIDVRLAIAVIEKEKTRA